MGVAEAADGAATTRTTCPNHAEAISYEASDETEAPLMITMILIQSVQHQVLQHSGLAKQSQSWCNGYRRQP